MNVLDDFFATGLPSEEEHAKLEDVERQYDMSRRTEKDLAIKLPPEQQIKKWEDLFGGQVPDEEDLSKWKDMSVRVQELRMQGEHSKLSEEATAQLDQLKYFFANKVPTEEELSQIEKDVVELSRLDGRIVEQDENYRNIKARVDMAQKTGRTAGKTAGGLVLFILFAALLLGGFSFRILAPEADGSTIYQILCFVGAAATGVAAIMQIGRIRSLHRNKQEDLQGQLAEAAEALAQSRETREVLAIRCKAFLADFKLTPADSMQQISYIVESFFNNKSCLIFVIAFTVAIIITYIIKRLSVDNAWTYAIAVGTVSEFIILIVGSLALNAKINIVFMIIGIIIGAVAAYICKIVFFSVDYKRTEFVQYEDDEYYYYVKAVPKISLVNENVKVKQINARKTRKTSDLSDIRRAADKNAATLETDDDDITFYDK